MGTEKTSLSLVTEGERAFQTLWERMDNDAKLAQLDPFLLKYFRKGKEVAVPGGVSVTMNDPAVLINALASLVMSGKWQVTVEGDISATQQHKIENFLSDTEDEANEYLVKSGMGRELTFLANHVCARGWIGERVLWLPSEKNKDNVYPQITLLDMRWCSYEQSTDGYNWVATRTWRSPSFIEREYDIVVRSNVTEIEVIDYWDGEKEEVWIDGAWAKTNKHRIGYPPFVIQAAPEGFMLLDKDSYMARKGESVLFLNRGLYNERNRSISIAQTLALKVLLYPTQKPTLDPPDEPAPYVSEPGTNTEVKPGEEYKLMPMQDINMAGRVGQAEIGDAIQRGGMNNLYFQEGQVAETATQSAQTFEVQTKVTQPRFDTIATLKEQRDRMFIDLYQKGGYKSPVGKMGRMRAYVASELGDLEKFTVTHRGVTRSKKQEIANLALFNASTELPMEVRLGDILMVDDVKGMMNQMAEELARKSDPFKFFYDITCSLFDYAASLKGEEQLQELIGANSMASKCLGLINQGQTPLTPPEPNKGNTNGLLPLMASGGMGV